MIRYILFSGLSVIIRWWWMLCCTMRCFSCCYCVAVMLLKVFLYTMTMCVVSRDEMFFMLLLRSSYAFESPSLYDDGGYCVSSWRRGVQSTRYELCFWKPVVGEERAYLGGAIAGDFQTRYGFCFFQLCSGCEKAEPVLGSFHRSFNPHVGSFHSPTWGYQKHNSYRVATPHNAFVMLYNTNYADNLSQIPPCIVVFWGESRTHFTNNYMQVSSLILVVWGLLCVHFTNNFMQLSSWNRAFGVQYSMALYQNTAHDLLLEGMKYGQLGTSCAFDSPTLANEMSLRGVKCVCRINPVWV